MVASRRRAPGLHLERALWDEGHDVVVGVDEVGKGSWAGPLTVAAVVLPRGRRVNGIRDSKMLTERRREELFDRIVDWCDGIGVGHATPQECDDLGMSEAQRLASRRAFAELAMVPGAALVDGKWDFVGGGLARMHVRGDSVSLSIATASVIAKVSRDRIMRREAEHFPAFSFDHNKGYPCPRHKMALQGYGPTTIHRRSWAFMDAISWRGAQRLGEERRTGADQPRLF